MSDVPLFLIQSIIVIALPYGLWRASRIERAVPLVVVQIFVGIALGPSVLGKIAPDIHSVIFRPGRVEALTGISSIAVLLFGFVTGLHLRREQHRREERTFVWTLAGSVIVPLAFGVVAGVIILTSFPGSLGPTGTKFQFVAAVAITTAVTALPVLGAILSELELLTTRLGQIALRLSAANDAVLWMLLAAVLGASGGGLSIAVTFVGLCIYVAVMIFIIGPFLDRLIAQGGADDEISDGALIAGISTALISATVTEFLGLHPLFGAFVAGAVMPRAMRVKLLRKIETTILLIFMPFFFVLGGLNVAVDTAAYQVVAIGLIFGVVAVVGKMVGIVIPCRSMSISSGEKLALGVLMSTKGLMEVVVLTVLLEAGLISKSVFAALLLTGLLLTAVVGPVTRRILRGDTYRIGANGALAMRAPLIERGSEGYRKTAK